MKKLIVLAVAALVTLALSAPSFAVGPGKKLDFEDGAQGKVMFDGTAHSKAGLKCNDCHPNPFKMKKGAEKITKADHTAGKFCGKCHDGKKAFAWSEEANCGKCHKK